MSTTDDGSWDEIEPEEWDSPDPGRMSPEAVENEPDDIVEAASGDDVEMPLEANEADVIEQRTESGLEDEDEGDSLQ